MSGNEGVGPGNKERNQECKEQKKKRVMKVKIRTLSGIKITVVKLTTGVSITRRSYYGIFSYLEFLWIVHAPSRVMRL